MSANPYKDNNLDPFANDFQRAPQPTAPVNFYQPPPPPQPASSPAATTPAPNFYNAPPTANTAQPSVQYNPAQQPQHPFVATSGPTTAAQQQPPPPPPQPEIQPTSKFWTIQFYQQFFDIDTKQVLRRMGNTMVPVDPPDFLLGNNWHYGADNLDRSESQLEQEGIILNKKADLYGPVWITTTLWMVLAIVGNIMSAISYSRQHQGTTSGWTYDFSQASVACITIYVYCFGMGALLWGLMKWKELPVGLVDTVCLYGYSMFIFLLAAILCMVPIVSFQWLVTIGCGLWSTAYLLLNFWHVWKSSLNKHWFIGVVSIVGIFHLLVTLSFKLYFFNYTI